VVVREALHALEKNQSTSFGGIANQLTANLQRFCRETLVNLWKKYFGASEVKKLNIESVGRGSDLLVATSQPQTSLAANRN